VVPPFLRVESPSLFYGASEFARRWAIAPVIRYQRLCCHGWWTSFAYRDERYGRAVVLVGVDAWVWRFLYHLTSILGAFAKMTDDRS
jgi:hypothetical protein